LSEVEQNQTQTQPQTQPAATQTQPVVQEAQGPAPAQITPQKRVNPYAGKGKPKASKPVPILDPKTQKELLRLRETEARFKENESTLTEYAEGILSTLSPSERKFVEECAGSNASARLRLYNQIKKHGLLQGKATQPVATTTATQTHEKRESPDESAFITWQGLKAKNKHLVAEAFYRKNKESIDRQSKLQARN
jgi:hypothetical protein